uniref:N(6)-L-threonylcarbamoyladenine synthase n=1 Tax=Lygus hesperus TaxID=30085 RepID=A0A0A9XY19_LYGHE
MTPCLRAGVQFASSVQQVNPAVPVVPVHHIEAHILAALFGPPHALHFPFLAVVLSGGHSQIVLCHKLGLYTVLSTTVDDACGDAYDKTCRTLQLEQIDLRAIQYALTLSAVDAIKYIHSIRLVPAAVVTESPGSILERVRIRVLCVDPS